MANEKGGGKLGVAKDRFYSALEFMGKFALLSSRNLKKKDFPERKDLKILQMQ